MRVIALLVALLISAPAFAQIGYKPPASAGGAVDETAAYDWTGLHTWVAEKASFGGAVGDAGACWFAANSLICEGATADAFETTITVTDPAVASTFTIGHSPDGNPWLGAGAGASAGATETNDVFLGENACTNAAGTSTNNTCVGDQAGSLLTTGDYNSIFGANSNVELVATTQATAIGRNTIAGTASVAVGDAAEAYGGSVSVGFQAGDAGAAVDVDNAWFGSQSGTASKSTSIDNSGFGDQSCDSLVSGDRNLCLGANSDVGTSTDSDSTQIGESIVGKGSDSYLDGFGGRERCLTQGTGKALTESTPTAFVRISVATESYTGAWIRWRVLADDGTDFQALSGESVIDVVNKGGAETCVIRTLPAFGDAVEADSDGGETLALEADPACATAAADTVDVSLDAVSSLTQTSLNVFYTVCVDGPLTTMTPQ